MGAKVHEEVPQESLIIPPTCVHSRGPWAPAPLVNKGTATIGTPRSRGGEGLRAQGGGPAPRERGERAHRESCIVAREADGVDIMIDGANASHRMFGERSGELREYVVSAPLRVLCYCAIVHIPSVCVISLKIQQHYTQPLAHGF